MEHSLIFPLPLSFHVVFVVFSVVMLILCYIKRKYMYELYMLIGVASTMLIYIADSKPVFYILGLEEMILLALTVIDMIKVSKAQKPGSETNEKGEDPNEDRTA